MKKLEQEICLFTGKKNSHIHFFYNGNLSFSSCFKFYKNFNIHRKIFVNRTYILM